MMLTETMMDYCMSQPWDADLRQDVFVKVLEYDGKPQDVNNAWLSRMYTNLLRNQLKGDARRRELERTASAAIEGIHGKDDVADPLEYLEAEQLMKDIASLSAVLFRTVRAVIMNGETPETRAKLEGVDVNTIYQRLHQAKKELTDGR